MTKSTITKTWIAGLILLAVGLVVGGLSMGLMFAYGGHFTPAASGNGSDFVPTLNGFFWTMVGLMVAGFTVVAIGGVVQLAAWIGALVNTYQFTDKTWFAILLGTGLLGLAFSLLGFAGMVAYLVAGPDGMPIQREAFPTPTQRPASLAQAS